MEISIIREVVFREEDLNDLNEELYLTLGDNAPILEMENITEFLSGKIGAELLADDEIQLTLGVIQEFIDGFLYVGFDDFYESQRYKLKKECEK